VISFGDVSDFISRPNELRREAASNLFDHLFGRGLADWQSPETVETLFVGTWL
jgi:hypothetical protein